MTLGNGCATVVGIDSDNVQPPWDGLQAPEPPGPSFTFQRANAYLHHDRRRNWPKLCAILPPAESSINRPTRNNGAHRHGRSNLLHLREEENGIAASYGPGMGGLVEPSPTEQRVAAVHALILAPLNSR